METLISDLKKVINSEIEDKDKYMKMLINGFLRERDTELLTIQGVVKSLNSDLQIGDEVLYVGKHLGTIVEDRNVKLKDGTLIASLDTQPHKFRKVL